MNVDDQIADIIRSYYPEWRPSAEPVVESSQWAKLTLPLDADADFRFVVSEYRDGECQIGAQLTAASESEYFWYTAYEVGAFPGDRNKLKKAFHDDLHRVLGHDTRVHQRNGLMFADFSCEYLVEGKWRSIAGASALRWSNFRIPEAPLYKSVYYRGPRGRQPVMA